MSADLIACPYCHEGDFDRIGLRSHLLHGDCAAFEETPDVRRFGRGMAHAERAESATPVESISDATRRLTLLTSALRRQGGMEAEGRFVPNLLRMDLRKLADVLDGISDFLVAHAVEVGK